MPGVTRRQFGTLAMLASLGLMSDDIMTPLWAAPPPQGQGYTEREEIVAFLKKVSQERHIPYAWLEDEVALARYSPLAERYSTPKPKKGPATTPERNFRLYQRNMVNSERIDKGVAFLTKHEALFADIEAKTGVSRYAITAIIGVETIYGKNMGRFRVLDVLVTLAFDYTRRADFYKKELAEFLEFCYRDKLPTVSVTGSYAGAVGYGQFMPSSLNQWGTDGDGDGLIDIIHNEADGIASVATYLKAHHWKPGLKPLYPVQQKLNGRALAPSTGIRPHYTVQALLESGLEPVGLLDVPLEEEVLLVDLPWADPGDEIEHRLYLGTQNFSAFLYYNRSYFYAAAVSLLAQAIEEQL